MLLLTLSAFGLCACEGTNSPGVTIELVDPAGDNAAFGIVEGTLSVEVRQGDSLLCADGCESPIRGGEFRLGLPLESLTEPTTIHGRISGADSPTTVGAVTRFTVAGEFLETAEVPVRMVMMQAGRCEPLTLPNISSEGRPRLVEPRRDAAAIVRRNLVMLAGGVGPSGGSARVDFFDQVVVEMRPPLDSPPLDQPLGITRGLALSEDESLVVGDTAWLYVSQRGPPAPTPVALHEGADGTSALVLLGSAAGVIGGTDTDQITWFSARGTDLGTGALLQPRSGAIAAAGANGALVVGGAEGGEWIQRPPLLSTAIDGLPDRSGGWIATSPSGRTFLWIGATGAETWLIEGCPEACEASLSPLRWETARSGAAATQTAAGVLWIVGGDGDSRQVDLVRWDGETPRLSTGPELSSGRAGATVVEQVSGVVLVIGGERADGFLHDAEICTPAEGLDVL